MFTRPSLPNRKCYGAEIWREISPSTTCHMSHVTCHMWRIMCHVSPVIFFVMVIGSLAVFSLMSLLLRPTILIKESFLTKNPPWYGDCLENMLEFLLLCYWVTKSQKGKVFVNPLKWKLTLFRFIQISSFLSLLSRSHSNFSHVLLLSSFQMIIPRYPHNPSSTPWTS